MVFLIDFSDFLSPPHSLFIKYVKSNTNKKGVFFMQQCIDRGVRYYNKTGNVSCHTCVFLFFISFERDGKCFGFGIYSSCLVPSFFYYSF